MVKKGAKFIVKILILTNHSYMFYRFRKELTQQLLKKYEVVISTPFVGHEDDLEALGCRCIETFLDRRSLNVKKDFELYQFYQKLLDQENPDLVITYSIKPNIYGGLACQKKKIPYYVNIQGLGTAFQKKGLTEVVTFLYKKALKGASRVYFENQANAETFLQYRITDSDRIKLLNGAGVNLEEYPYMTYPTDPTIHFLFIGRIMKEKGTDELFYAAEKLKEKYQEKVAFHLVGFFEDSYAEKVKQLVDQEIIEFHGFTTDTKPFYQDSHCIILPSYHEGMSNVLLEAAACGRPVITTDIPGCREAVIDGETGFLSQVKNKEDLLEKVDRFIQLQFVQQEKMGRSARKHIETHFSKEKVVHETVSCIQE